MGRQPMVVLHPFHQQSMKTKIQISFLNELHLVLQTLTYLSSLPLLSLVPKTPTPRSRPLSDLLILQDHTGTTHPLDPAPHRRQAIPPPNQVYPDFPTLLERRHTQPRGLHFPSHHLQLHLQVSILRSRPESKDLKRQTRIDSIRPVRKYMQLHLWAALLYPVLVRHPQELCRV